MHPARIASALRRPGRSGVAASASLHHRRSLACAATKRWAGAGDAGRKRRRPAWTTASASGRFCFPIASGRRSLGTTAAGGPGLSTPPVGSEDRPVWLKRLDEDPSAPMEPQAVYRYLGMKDYTREELEDRFRGIAGGSPAAPLEKDGAGGGPGTEGSPGQAGPRFDRDRLRSYLSQRIRAEEREVFSDPSAVEPRGDRTEHLRSAYIEAETRRLWNFLQGGEDPCPDRTREQTAKTKTATTMAVETACDRVLVSARAVDGQRLWPLTLSMVMIGLSVGVTTPAFPFVVQNLGLSTGEYGMVVSAFALTKLFGNIPFAVLVETNGRKPYLVYTMIAISTGVGCIGLASGFEELYACRLVTGLGVAGLSCAATMTVTDISTPLNRASSFAPISAGFAAGTALGPALGGVLIDQIGVNPTFYLVGGSFLMLGGVNSFLLDETLRKPNQSFPWREETKTESKTDDDEGSIKNAFHKALGQWVPLLSEAPVRSVCIINGFYWVALAGSQMTLLPLVLTDPHGLAMTATQVGQVYMGMSFVQVFGNPLFARIVDRAGTVPGIVGGCSLISGAMFALPHATASGDLGQMAAVLGVWSAGSSLLSTAPIAHISDRVDDARRAQAIALLRTSGDVGFLVGASTMGLLSDWTGGLDTAMQSSAAILATATSWYCVRSAMTSRQKQ
ncbi:unnamed protein product [Pseudo-nitzschia multistriata]|uniref:Major facilitator superfamily (MFS) profile domain-containing protein n=1 Tax=Pseudo-nitzschia multistriata TaxID=183589 RepID=A0A448Z957_9STRA|nr:unnamed protein product [Pseudo-nitzschia multistriata]